MWPMALPLFAPERVKSLAPTREVTGKKQVPFSGFSGEDAKVSMLQKIARFVRGNFFVPDARKGWNDHAYRAAEQIIKQHGVRHWITTSPPHSTQLVGLKLKQNTASIGPLISAIRGLIFITTANSILQPLLVPTNTV